MNLPDQRDAVQSVFLWKHPRFSGSLRASRPHVSADAAVYARMRTQLTFHHVDRNYSLALSPRLALSRDDAYSLNHCFPPRSPPYVSPIATRNLARIAILLSFDSLLLARMCQNGWRGRLTPLHSFNLEPAITYG